MSGKPFDPSDSPTLTRDVHDSPTITVARVAPKGSLAPGQNFGPYQIRRLLGRGGMGEVYEAVLRESGRLVALKVLSDPDPLPEARERFLREGRLAASVNHPNSVYIYGTEEIEGRWAISMELVGGGSLKDRVREKGMLSPQEAVDAILDVIAGLDAAASAGVLHRDIKPANCFVEPDGAVKIGDFGLSLSTLGRDESRSHLTRSGAFLGTPAFASPEQLRGEVLDVRSDIYSVGATLYYLLTGHPPFEADNLMKLLTTIAEQAPRSPRILRHGVSRGLARVVLQCLAKKPEARPRDYSELTDKLLSYGTQKEAPHAYALAILAAVLDTGLTYAIGWVALSLVAFGRGDLAAIEGWAWAAASLLAFGAPSLIAGRSLGERLLGLRVRDGTGPPRLLRSLARVALTAAFCGWFLPREGGIYLAAMFHIIVSPVLGLSPRRSIRPHRSHRGAAPTHPERRPTAVPIGPYWIAEQLRADAFVLGFDPVLNREVWIARRAAGEASGSTAEPVRQTRLRKIQEGSLELTAWAAYEAPFGHSLLDLPTPLPWDDVRHVLLQVTREILAVRREGSLAGLALERVWLKGPSEVVLLERAPPGGSPDTHAFSTDFDGAAFSFIHEVATRLLGSALEAQAAPRNGQCFLEELGDGGFQNLEAVETMLSVLCRGQARRRRLEIGAFGLFVAYQWTLMPFTTLDGQAVIGPLILCGFIGSAIRAGQYREQAIASQRGLHSIFDQSEEIVRLSGGAPSLFRWLVRDFAAILPTVACWFLLRGWGASGMVTLFWTAAVFLVTFGSALSTGIGFQGWVSGTRRIASHQPFGDRPPQMNRYEVLRAGLPSTTPATEDDWHRWEVQIAACLPPLMRFMNYGARRPHLSVYGAELRSAFLWVTGVAVSVLLIIGISLYLAPSPGAGLVGSMTLLWLIVIGIALARARKAP